MNSNLNTNSNPNATLGSPSPITTTTIQANNEPEDDEILTADLKTEDNIFILLIVSFHLLWVRSDLLILQN
jgi:hypothetical protein